VPKSTKASPEQRAKAEAIVADFLEKDKVGGVVLVTRGKQVVYKSCRGCSDIYERRPFTTRTIFNLGSLSKQFISLGVMMLHEQGKLGYDDPIGQYIPELQHLGSDVTIRHLMNHTSGLPDLYADKRMRQLLLAKKGATNADVLELLKERGRLKSKPGEKFVYSNTGYEVLASLIEKLSNQTLAAFMEERVFGPLKMRDTFTLTSSGEAGGKNLARSYTQLRGQLKAVDTDPLDHILGAHSFYSTAEDLAVYDRALYSNKLVKQTTLAEAFKPIFFKNGDDWDYGFGWEVGTVEGSRFVSHQGSWLAFNVYFARFLDAHLSVIVLLNRNYDLPDDEIAQEIGTAFLR
jgi:CubicO group peptidase (beta-lactamase class C family)